MNRVIYFLLILFAGLAPGFSMAQNPPGCDTVYFLSKNLPRYRDGVKDMHQYIDRELSDLIHHIEARDSVKIDLFTVILIIDKKGKVTSVEFPSFRPQLFLSEQARAELSKKLLAMNDWRPGKVDGQPVCSKYLWEVNCEAWILH